MEALQHNPRGFGLALLFAVFVLACSPASSQDADGSSKPAEKPGPEKPGPEKPVPEGSKLDQVKPSADPAPSVSDPDRVILLNGAVYKGDVIETGGNSIRLEIGGGSRRFHKRDIKKIEFNRMRAAGARLSADRLEFRDGHKLDGDVEVIDGGQKVRIRLVPKKKAGRKPTAKRPTVVFPMSQIKRIRWKDELQFSAQGNYYTKELEERIGTSISDLASGDAETRAKAEEYLTRAGSFAEEAIAKAYDLRVKTVKPESREGDPFVLALRRVIQSNRLKRIVVDEIESAAPEIYRTLSYATESDKKVEFLKAIVPNFTDQAVELAIAIVKDPYESEQVRSLTVDLLRRLQLNQALLNLYNSSGGALKLVSAVALSRNRILLGVPTMIDALEIDDLNIRKLAAESLRANAGQDFRFRADGAVAARASAVKKWRLWWQQNQEEIEKNAILVLRGGRGESPEWKQAAAFWKQGHDAWLEKNLTKASTLFLSAVETDPTYVKAAISLAALYYTEMGKIDDAEKLLVDLVRRPVVNVTERDSYWIHYELANVYRLKRLYRKALNHYEESSVLDPQSFYSIVGKADCHWLLATDGSKLDVATRRKLYWKARDGYLEALEKTEALMETLTVLRSDELPSLDSLPFARRIHNRTVLDVRKGFGTEIVRIHQKIAKVYTVTGDHPKAALQLQKGIDSMSIALAAEEAAPLEAELRNYLALSLERQGKSLEAFKEYRHVLRHLDGENATSRKGLARLQRKVSGK